MTSQLTSVRQDFNRNHNKWPLIIPPGGGKPVAYRRTTKYVSVIEDLWNLQQWEKRKVAEGLAKRRDLLLAVQAVEDPDKQKGHINDLCKQAKDAAGGNAGAITGTALHALTDIVDSGGELGPVDPGPAASIAAFREATAPLKVVAIEQKLVLDTHKVAGTADRLYEYEGQCYIGDTKSGNIELGILKICMQLAVYARSEMYDVETGARTIHGASTTRAIVMHMPATDDPDKAKCELVWVDIESGWQAVMVARQIWEMRSLKYPQLAKSFVAGEAQRPSLRLEKKAEVAAENEVEVKRRRLELMILACSDRHAVEQLWADYQPFWNDHLTEVAKKHVASLSHVA